MHREKKIRKILFDGQKENSGSQILTSEFDIYFFKAVHSFTDFFFVLQMLKGSWLLPKY